MTAETGLIAWIVQAERKVRNARRYWDPSNLSSCEQCAEQLKQAIEMVAAAQQAAAQGAAEAGARARLTRLRGEVEVLSRLADSAMAFSRGLALRMTSQEPVHSELKG